MFAWRCTVPLFYTLYTVTVNWFKAQYMTRVFVSLPDDVAERFRALVPFRERSKVIERLLAKELQARENVRDAELFAIAEQVENEAAFVAVREVSTDVDNVAGEALD